LGNNIGRFKALPIFIAWGAWKIRNKLIFEGRTKNSNGILGEIIDFFFDYISLRSCLGVDAFVSLSVLCLLMWVSLMKPNMVGSVEGEASFLF